MSLTKGEKRYLSRRVCAWCDQRLDAGHCGAIWERCSEETWNDRQKRCLEGYNPRKRAGIPAAPYNTAAA